MKFLLAIGLTLIFSVGAILIGSLIDDLWSSIVSDKEENTNTTQNN